MQSLNNIMKDVMALESLIIENQGEVCETLDTWMQINEQNMAEKIDGYAYLIDKLDSTSDFFDKKAKELTQAKKVCQNQIDKLKANLEYTMSTLNTDELLGDSFRYKLQNGKPKVEILDDALIPMYLIREKITLEPDKDKIKAELEKGEPLEFARLVESKTLRRYTNNKKLEGKK